VAFFILQLLDMLICEFRDDSCNCVYKYKKECKKYINAFIKSNLKHLCVSPSVADIKNTKDIDFGNVYTTTSAQKLTVAFTKFQYRNLTKSKILNYNTAIQYMLNGDEVSEKCIIIDTRIRNISEPKGLSVIESFCDKMIDEGAVVVILHAPGQKFNYNNVL
jgi:hypothetical protein